MTITLLPIFDSVNHKGLRCVVFQAATVLRRRWSSIIGRRERRANL